METINDAQITTGYNYDTDNRVTGVVHSLNLGEDAEAEATVSRGYTYDAYGRLSTRVAGNGTATAVVTDEFIYRSPSTGATSGQVSQLKTTAAGYSKTYTYTYDANGNITAVSDGTKTTSYVYDSQNQLLRENNQAANKTWVWTYDDAGNILSKTEYAYTGIEDLTGLTPTDTILYTYGNAQWGDLLTGYDGKTLTYDTVGNLISDGTWEYEWEHGRQLASMTNGTKTWSFTYNSDGLRTGKTDGTTTYDYVYNGSQLMQMTVTTSSDTYVFHFTYDASGTPLSFTLNGTLYYYVTNLQGDVVAILNVSGGLALDYTYSAWGGRLSSTITSDPNWRLLLFYNPLMYRGYVSDWEIGLYYLQSRYYNPTIGRFINADAYVSTGQGFTGNNMFAYCGNNPVNYSDPAGGYYRSAGSGIRSVYFESPGDMWYSTEEEAAFAAGTRTRMATNIDDNEYVCGVYKLNNGKYTIGYCFKGEHVAAYPHYVQNEAVRYSERELVALVHSHPYCTGHEPNEFSKIYCGEAIGDLLCAAYLQIPIYLAAPNGNLMILRVTAFPPTYNGWTDDYYDSYVVRGGLPVDNSMYDCLR